MAKVNGELTDHALIRSLDGAEVEFFTKEDPEGLFTLRHTRPHVIAPGDSAPVPWREVAIRPAIIE